MASTAQPPNPERLERLLPDRLLGALALAMLAAVIAAVIRGQPEWARVPWAVWVHLSALGLVLALTPVQLWARKGTQPHRLGGYLWAGSMMVAAGVSFLIRDIADGGLSWIHALSAFVLFQTPRLVLAARAGDTARHRRHVRNLTLFALLVAGFFTFPFGRMLGRWLMG